LADGEDLYGTAVIVANRLCETAHAGEILASEAIRHIAGVRVSELLSPAGALRLRGVAARVAMVRVHWNDDPDAAAPAVREAEPTGRPITVPRRPTA